MLWEHHGREEENHKKKKISCRETQKRLRKSKNNFNKENVYPSKINTFNTLCVYYIKDMSCSLKYLFSKWFWGSIMITGYMKLSVLTWHNYSRFYIVHYLKKTPHSLYRSTWAIWSVSSFQVFIPASQGEHSFNIVSWCLFLKMDVGK